MIQPIVLRIPPAQGVSIQTFTWSRLRCLVFNVRGMGIAISLVEHRQAVVCGLNK